MTFGTTATTKLAGPVQFVQVAISQKSAGLMKLRCVDLQGPGAVPCENTPPLLALIVQEGKGKSSHS